MVNESGRPGTAGPSYRRDCQTLRHATPTATPARNAAATRGTSMGEMCASREIIGGLVRFAGVGHLAEGPRGAKRVANSPQSGNRSCC